MTTLLQNIATQLSAYPKRYLIDQNLDLIDKTTLSWTLQRVVLTLLQPFYRLFGQDAFSHVRIHAVASSILALCQRNQSEFLDPLFADHIQTGILRPLKHLTGSKYLASLNQAGREIRALAPPNPVKTPTMQELYPLFDPELAADPAIRESVQAALELLARLEESPYTSQLTFSKEGEKGERVRVLTLTEHTGWEANEAHAHAIVVPRSFHLVTANGVLQRMVLISKKVLAAGGQTRVRTCVDLLKREILVKKGCSDIVHQALLVYLHQTPQRGLTPIVALRTREAKRDFFEPCVNTGTLLHALNVPRLMENQSRVKIARDLIMGLKNLHGVQHAGLTFSEPSAPPTGPFRYAHRDLKPLNVLIHVNGGEVRAALTDFGSTNPSLDVASLGFRAPDQVRRMLAQSGTDRTLRQATLENIEEMQKGDLWGLGLLLVMLLKKRAEDIAIVLPENDVQQTLFAMPPLRFLNRVLGQLRREPNRLLLEPGIAELTQDDLDGNIRESHQDNAFEAQFAEIVIGLLQVDPAQRISLERALSMLDSIELTLPQ